MTNKGSHTMHLETALSRAATAVNGLILKAGARLDMPRVVNASFGHTHVFNNSAALRIAAEQKNYSSVAVMLDKASSEEGGFATRHDFGLGKDWDRVMTLRANDPILDEKLQAYEKRADDNIDALFALAGISPAR